MALELASGAERFEAVVDRIEELLEQYDPGDLAPERLVRDVTKDRALQRPLLEQVVEETTNALKSFPSNGTLLRQRAFAYSRIVGDDLWFPFADHAMRDLRAALAFEPDNAQGGLALVDSLFDFSVLENSEVAEICGDLAEQAERTLLGARALQIRALLYTGQKAEATGVWKRWARLFPDDAGLDEAIGEFDDLLPKEGDEADEWATQPDWEEKMRRMLGSHNKANAADDELRCAPFLAADL